MTYIRVGGRGIPDTIASHIDSKTSHMHGIGRLQPIGTQRIYQFVVAKDLSMRLSSRRIEITKYHG